VDWAGLRSDINAWLSADLRRATASLRLSFHVGGTHDVASGLGGSQCPFNASSPANAGLGSITSDLGAMRVRYPGVSNGDVLTLAGVLAVRALQGPPIPWRAGRLDLPCVAALPADVALPDATSDGFAGGAPTQDRAAPSVASFAPAAVRAKFSRMGLNDVDTVALMGAHTVGHARTNASGFFGAWSSTPFRFTNGALLRCHVCLRETCRVLKQKSHSLFAFLCQSSL
jgi:cytochrome c peroxidase